MLQVFVDSNKIFVDFYSIFLSYLRDVHNSGPGAAQSSVEGHLEHHLLSHSEIVICCFYSDTNESL